MMRHTMNVPDIIWEWAQKKYNCKNPGPNLRNDLVRVMVEDVSQPRIAAVEEDVTPLDSFETRWAELNCSLDSFDDEFASARRSFVVAHGSEHKAILWLVEAVKNRSIKNPRAFIMSWWKKHR